MKPILIAAIMIAVLLAISTIVVSVQLADTSKQLKAAMNIPETLPCPACPACPDSVESKILDPSRPLWHGTHPECTADVMPAIFTDQRNGIENTSPAVCLWGDAQTFMTSNMGPWYIDTPGCTGAALSDLVQWTMLPPEFASVTPPPTGTCTQDDFVAFLKDAYYWQFSPAVNAAVDLRDTLARGVQFAQ